MDDTPGRFTALVTMTKCRSVHLTVFLFLSDYNFSASFAPCASPDLPLGRFAAATNKTSYYTHRTQVCNNVKWDKTFNAFHTVVLNEYCLLV